jgi:ABC-type cobalamin/Fe3+-siderophores transport system ATPase subunit
VNEETKEFIEFAYFVKNAHSIQRQIALDAKSDTELLDFYDAILDFLDKLIQSIALENPKINYLNQFREDLERSIDYIVYKAQTNNSFVYGNERAVLEQLKAQKKNSDYVFKRASFKLNFFNQLGFFKNNVVVIGANGSGKTSISNKFKELMSDNGVVISAQRILFVPTFDSIHNPSTTLNALKQVQIVDKTNKGDNFAILQSEFEIVLRNLLADNNKLSSEYRTLAIKLANENIEIPPPLKSNLDRTFEIWNSLIEHREIVCIDGMNISIRLDNGTYYPAIKMSDGEKVILFLISQVLQAPQDGFVIVDEPEMYLHKTILKKLWDILENQRQDCLFIYMTHDLDYATSRITAKKIWIKSFTHPETWDMEPLPENDLPESLLMELLGSRKNILFCEGEKGKIDEKIYNTLFPNYTITPVGGCFEVINHTKAFNKIANLTIKAKGLIDSDHHPIERLEKLEGLSIHHFKVAEVENLLLDEHFLKKLAENIMVDPEKVIKIKEDVIGELDKRKEIQAAHFVSTRVDYYFKDSNIKKGNNVQDLQSNYLNFTNEVKIEAFYKERLSELESIVISKDYSRAISVFNNKGISKIVETHFKISDFTDRAIRLLQLDNTTHSILLKHFPQELIFESAEAATTRSQR